MRKALLVLQATEDYSVKSWLRNLKKNRDWLRRLCAAALGLTPKEITWTFFDARVRREAGHGRSEKQIAASLGLANAYTLRRAYARRGIPFPRP